MSRASDTRTLLTYFSFFFFNDTATTEIYTLSLHDALPISHDANAHPSAPSGLECQPLAIVLNREHALLITISRQPHYDKADRKSTRLNSSHLVISYAVFCLKKKKILIILISSTSVHDSPLL